MAGNGGNKHDEQGTPPASQPASTPISRPGELKTISVPGRVQTSRSRAVFTVVGGPDAGMVISIPAGNVVTLGRSEDTTIRFDDAGLSRVHARLMRVAGECVLSDANSTNGTFVNDVRLAKPQPLRDGDRVRLGSAVALRFAFVDEEEEAALRRVYDAAVKDGLTGVSNRKHLEERLEQEVAYSNRHGTSLSIVMIDIDFFKRVNDTHGHLGGDAVLRAMGALLQRTVRVEDVVARYGGEEFVVLARGIDVRNARLLAERIRQTVLRTSVPFEKTTISFTSSAGVASLDCCGAQRDKQTLLSVADARLYQAKHEGRNRVVGGELAEIPRPRSGSSAALGPHHAHAGRVGPRAPLVDPRSHHRVAPQPPSLGPQRLEHDGRLGLRAEAHRLHQPDLGKRPIGRAIDEQLGVARGLGRRPERDVVGVDAPAAREQQQQRSRLPHRSASGATSSARPRSTTVISSCICGYASRPVHPRMLQSIGAPGGGPSLTHSKRAPR